MLSFSLSKTLNKGGRCAPPSGRWQTHQWPLLGANCTHKLHQPESVVIAALEAKIREAIADGFVTFISGMAWGVDIWAAEIVLRLKAEGHPIHLIAAVPYEGFEKSWDDDWKQRYHAVLSAADFVKYICDHYHRGCFQVRNEWMVDRSALLIAAYTGEKGGTKNTVDYAARKGVQTVFVL